MYLAKDDSELKILGSYSSMNSKEPFWYIIGYSKTKNNLQKWTIPVKEATSLLRNLLL